MLKQKFYLSVHVKYAFLKNISKFLTLLNFNCGRVENQQYAIS